MSRYVNYNLVQDFIRPFKDPSYHCFQHENTAIALDPMEGRSSFGHHAEVALNPLLSGKEGKMLQQQITAEFRKSVVLRIDAHLTDKVKKEGAHESLAEAVRERVLNDQIKFAKLAKGYKTNLGTYTWKLSHWRSKADSSCA